MSTRNFRIQRWNHARLLCRRVVIRSVLSTCYWIPAPCECSSSTSCFRIGWLRSYLSANTETFVYWRGNRIGEHLNHDQIIFCGYARQSDSHNTDRKILAFTEVMLVRWHYPAVCIQKLLTNILLLSWGWRPLFVVLNLISVAAFVTEYWIIHELIYISVWKQNYEMLTSRNIGLLYLLFKWIKCIQCFKFFVMNYRAELEPLLLPSGWQPLKPLLLVLPAVFVRLLPFSSDCESWLDALFSWANYPHELSSDRAFLFICKRYTTSRTAFPLC